MVDEQRLSFRSTFMLNMPLSRRLEAAMRLQPDPGPATNSEPLERVLAALFAGERIPEIEAAQVIDPVMRCVEELFILRDRSAVS